MKKFFILSVLLFALMSLARAQIKTPVKIDSTHVKVTIETAPEKFKTNDSAYRALAAKRSSQIDKVDSTDLKLTSCDFEKDANAMVLADLAQVSIGPGGIVMERHKRIKIFNDNGKDEANIHIEYNNQFGAEQVLAVVAETMNFVNGKIEYSKLDSSLVYKMHTDKNKDAIVFSLPNVKAGSVIEYSYLWQRATSRNIPDWDFQTNIPTVFSAFHLLLNPFLQFTVLNNTDRPFAKDTVSLHGYGHLWAMTNIPSAREEPFMRSATDGLQHISLIIKSVEDFYGKTSDVAASWAVVGKQIADDKQFSKPYDQNLNDIDDLVTKAKALHTDDEKIEFLFNQVKILMKWNQEKNWASKNGIKAAWKNKSGSWGEVNMILYHLLKQAGIKAYPLLVSTRDNGAIYANFVNAFQINKLVTYVPVDSSKYYVLDATDKYNLYNEIPFNLLNSSGLCLDREKDKYYLVFMKRENPVRQVVAIKAEIKADGTMNGTAQVNSFSYNKSISLELHKTLDEKKYEAILTDNDNNLKITSLKFENAEADSLPLTQDIDFKLDLSGTDDKYIYFNPNLFTSLHDNPFISENRASDIDFGFKNILSISGRYKMPGGYKIDAMPKSIIIIMPDSSISFKRILQEEDGYIVVHYVVNYKKSIYPKTDYDNIHAYFKKMFELLNEQIVLKKS